MVFQEDGPMFLRSSLSSAKYEQQMMITHKSGKYRIPSMQSAPFEWQ